MLKSYKYIEILKKKQIKKLKMILEGRKISHALGLTELVSKKWHHKNNDLQMQCHSNANSYIILHRNWKTILKFI